MNLKQVRIQNFRNLKDVTINLNDVNLLIGPNNSGKSNVLHAIRLGSMIVKKHSYIETEIPYTTTVKEGEYIKWLTSTGLQKNGDKCNLSFVFDLEGYKKIAFYLSCTIKKDLQTYEYMNWGFTDRKDISIEQLEDFYSQNHSMFILRDNYGIVPSANQYKYLVEVSQQILKQFVNFPIYEIAPKELRKPYGLTNDKFIEFDGSNIVSFFDYLNSSREDIKEEFKKTLTLISKDFSGYRLEGLDYIPEEIRKKFPTDTIKKFGLIDSKSYENTIWAEYLSDGILYFLALLCVVHQPYPPPILLLEEPEKGIHPRRIREVMDLLFALAAEKKIQIILTTHSTFVVDEFTDVPENVTVFDNNGETITVKNLKNDIIDKINNSLEKNNYSKDYLQNSLGENWALGLLGGVPI